MAQIAVTGTQMRITPLSNTGTYSTTASWTATGTYSFNIVSTGSWWQPAGKVKNGKYRVRCRGCARWAKVVSEKGMVIRVHCDRCLGEQNGFLG